MILGGIVCVIIAAVVIFIVNQNKTPKEPEMTTYEAQTKCVLMEQADLVNLMGEPFGSETYKKAEEFCLSQWDRTKNPDNTEEKFKEIIKTDWENRKSEVLDGNTLEEYFNEWRKTNN